MLLYYHKAPKKNFGDDLNSWLWPRILPGFFDQDPSSWMSVIGTIINNKMPEAKLKIVFSSGAGYEAPPKGFGGPGWTVVCVRGPLTAKVLNLPQDLAITDGAILLASFPEYTPLPESDRKGIIFMPHHRALDYGCWEQVCKKAGIGFVSPREDSQEIIKKLRAAKVVLADAMHAAIVADTLRVPWVPVVASSSINGFKWHDWVLSLGLQYKPILLPSSTMGEAITRALLNAFGGMHITGDTPEQAYKDYCRKYINMGPGTRYLVKKSRLGIAKSLRYCAKALECIYLGKMINNSMIDKAAESLQTAAAHPPLLSSESIFNIRLKQMCDKVAYIKKSVS